ncbi:predicted protein [Chaetomium globosum CBS 148.51]|uniref:Uncharacterized protein n=1 Tax=Chaetomium globosum (strain ATCC 6205 / CBS 148.51 / DSM 1962 / NBRC 6347 / NRRL 1970) TaxID=306901 RepID=Q2HF45_CHAGB|nr:uncharacterized protein CHGG_01159 [Chaetomium globosum CBS 148.51]EAQ92924.1 predicted protein [Chaetomium globosum CBS 148.51]
MYDSSESVVALNLGLCAKPTFVAARSASIATNMVRIARGSANSSSVAASFIAGF